MATGLVGATLVGSDNAGVDKSAAVAATPRPPCTKTALSLVPLPISAELCIEALSRIEESNASSPLLDDIPKIVR